MKRGLGGAIVITLILLPTVTIAAMPIYFLDQSIVSLEQLDQALIEGEIRQEDYDILVEFFLSGLADTTDAFQRLLIPEGEAERDAPPVLGRFDFEYHGTFRQDLESDFDFVRYDKIRIGFGTVRLDLSLEQRDGEELLLRSRSVAVHHRDLTLTLGSYNLRLGQGLTQGYANFHSEFKRRDDFTASLAQPIKNRENGLLLRQTPGFGKVVVFASYREGEHFRKRTYGSSMQLGKGRRRVGVIGMLHELDQIGSAKRSIFFLAPYYHFKLGKGSLWGESSFGIENASAHLTGARFQAGKSRHEVQFFSYARNYTNLQSGGYAYSDYDPFEIDEIGLTYSEKRSGRLGVSIRSDIDIGSKARLNQTVVRWKNRLDSRECVAVNTVFKVNDPLDLKGYIRIGGIWENLDLEGNQSSRTGVSLNTSVMPNSVLRIRSHHKLERRIRDEATRYPFRSRVEAELHLTDLLSTLIELNYYDPDSKTSHNSYGYFSIGEIISDSHTFSLSLKVRGRYNLGTGAFSDWELRAYCDFNY